MSAQHELKKIRRDFELRCEEWSSGVRLLKSFVPQDSFFGVAQFLRRFLKHRGPLRIQLSRPKVWHTRKGATIGIPVTTDPPERIGNWVKSILTLLGLPLAILEKDEFAPYILIGTFSGENQRNIQEILEEARRRWTPCEFVCGQLDFGIWKSETFPRVHNSVVFHSDPSGDLPSLSFSTLENEKKRSIIEDLWRVLKSAVASDSTS